MSVSPEPVIYLVDDEPDFLASLSVLLAANGYRVSAFGTASEFLAQLPTNPLGCVVLDLVMEHLSGLHVQEELARRGSPLPIVFLSGQATVRDAVSALKAGAEDFLIKPFEAEELLAAIRNALEKEDEMREQRRQSWEAQRCFENLTPRERQILELVTSGQLNKEMAYVLGISERTVKFHRQNLMAKLGVPSLVELIQLCQRAGKTDGNASSAGQKP